MHSKRLPWRLPVVVIILAAGITGVLLFAIKYRREANDFGLNSEQPPSVAAKPPAKKSARITNQKFLAHLSQGFQLPDEQDEIALRVLSDYGAMFVAVGEVKPPPRCVFRNEQEVQEFQKQAGFTSANVGGAKIDLQPSAMTALLAARDEAHQAGLDITPRGGSEAARRSYADTVRLWYSRVNPALSYWQGRGRLSSRDVENLRRLSPEEQVPRVLELEQQGIFFSQDLSKSILYSIAAPGTSQHISMLALDVSQFADARVRTILARHGWFQTVFSDLPHFTYLGLAEKELSDRGLHQVKAGNQVFWIPLLTE